jgi:hypothetical protein
MAQKAQFRHILKLWHWLWISQQLLIPSSSSVEVWKVLRQSMPDQAQLIPSFSINVVRSQRAPGTIGFLKKFL